jgi:serine/threonine protein kinase
VIFIAGSRVGPYQIVAPLGAGGMGEVYRARDPRIGREVAVKVLPPAFAADADRVRRFEQEARAAGALNHPGLLTIFDVGTHDDILYIVSELLDGGHAARTDDAAVGDEACRRLCAADRACARHRA